MKKFRRAAERRNRKNETGGQTRNSRTGTHGKIGSECVIFWEYDPDSGFRHSDEYCSIFNYDVYICLFLLP